MATKYRITGHKTAKIPDHLLGVYRAPEEVILLIEDVMLLDIIINLLGKLDRNTINDDDNEAGVTVRRLNFILYAIRNKARKKLNDYLNGQSVKPRQKPQSMADIWELMRESLERQGK